MSVDPYPLALSLFSIRLGLRFHSCRLALFMDFTTDKCKHSRCYYYQVGACCDYVVNLTSVLLCVNFRVSSISVVLVHDHVKFPIQRHGIDILVFTSTSASSTNSLFRSSLRWDDECKGKANNNSKQAIS